MKKTRKMLPILGKGILPVIAFFVFTQCSEELKIETEPAAKVETVSNDAKESDFSLTIDGVHTVLSSFHACKKCDYIVPEDVTVVDGKALGIKPGQAICLDADFKYGSVKLINLEGEAKNPIVVAYGLKDVLDFPVTN
jgi:hypothetical protein